MEWARLAGVTGAGGPGSGYVVAPQLVLTSAHVVGQRGAVAFVFRPGRAGRFAGRVVWCGTPGGRDDAALVAIDDPDWTPVDGAVARWGKSVTHRPGLRCECWGVPEVMHRPGRPVDTAQLTGVLNPGDGMVGDRYPIRLDGYPPATGEDGRSPWGGLSGAAVFSGDLLIGVIAVDPAPFRHSVLEAVPAYVLHHDPEFRAVLANYAAATVIEGAKLTGLASTEPAPHPQGAVVSPAELLTARRAVVGFRGRAELLDSLRTSAEQPGVGVWLVHGPGGQGKTRLARHFGEQFAQDAARRGTVLWLDRTAPAKDLAVIADTVVPVLVVVDYAESRPDQLAALLTALATRRRSPAVKVLTLARTAGDWWDQLADTSDAVATLLDAATVTALPVLDATDTARQEGYRAAVAAFAEELAHLPGHADTDWSARAEALVERSLPSTTGAWTVLAIQMTALADLLDTTEPGRYEGDQPEAIASARGADRVSSPEKRVLRHERRYWKNTAIAAGVYPALGMGTLTDTVAATVLLQPPMPAQADKWFTRIPGLADQPLDRRDRVRAWLAGLYPAAGSYAFGQLEPDRLAEHLIGTLIADQTRTSIVEILAACVDGADATRWVSVCARAAGHPGLGDPVGELLTQMFKKQAMTVAVAALEVAPGLEAPEPLVRALECLVRDPATPTACLTSVAKAMPERSLLWAATFAEVCNVLAVRCRPEEPDYDAMEQNRPDLTDVGNHIAWLANEALRSKGMRIEWSRSDLASYLNESSVRLAALGRREEALVASTKAVQIYRRLTENQDSECLPGLAGSLGNHSNRLAALGRRQDALDAITEAVQIFRRLADERPDAFLPDVAKSLNPFSTALAALGQLQDAQAAYAETVQIFRRLADERPDAFLPDFARSLGNYGMNLAALGQLQDAQAAYAETVQIFRRLAEERPDAFLPEFAYSLSNHSNCLADLGQPKDALVASAEAVQIYRRLVEAGHDALLPGFAMSLYNHSRGLAASGQWQDALAVSTEAVRIYRRLAEDQDSESLHGLAGSLNNRAICLAVLRRPEDALVAITEAIAMRQQLVKSQPGVYQFQAELDQSLHVLSVLQDKGV